MHEKHPHTPNEEYLSVVIDFCWNLMNLMAVKKLKNNFSKLTVHEILKFSWTVSQS